MRLLIFTQILDRNDDVLGFFHKWAEEFAKNIKQLQIVCLFEGEHSLPPNVSVYSLGKEDGSSKLAQIYRFYKYIFSLKYDTVFVHMNPEYIVLGGLLWRASHKRVALWYTHRAVHWKLRVATMFSNKVFSASGYSFRLKTDKLRVLGHGIDVDSFVCGDAPKGLHIATIGRITPIKDQVTLVRAAKILKDQGGKFTVSIIGSTATEMDVSYETKLTSLVKELDLAGEIGFVGSIPNRQVSKHYCDSTIVVNMVPDGGVDKTVIESMASGRIPITSNRAFEEYFGQYAERLIFKHGSAKELALKIKQLSISSDKIEISNYLKGVARSKFSAQMLIRRIIDELE